VEPRGLAADDVEDPRISAGKRLRILTSTSTGILPMFPVQKSPRRRTHVELIGATMTLYTSFFDTV
jgi:hypothetical protein